MTVVLLRLGLAGPASSLDLQPGNWNPHLQAVAAAYDPRRRRQFAHSDLVGPFARTFYRPGYGTSMFCTQGQVPVQPYLLLLPY